MHFIRINTDKRTFIKDIKSRGWGVGGMRMGERNQGNQEMKGGRSPAQNVPEAIILFPQKTLEWIGPSRDPALKGTFQ